MDTRLLPVIGVALVAMQAVAQVVNIDTVPKVVRKCAGSDNGSDCLIGVLVTESIDKTKCTVSLVDPTQNVVGVTRGARVLLMWNIDPASTPGYGFSDDDGVEFINVAAMRNFDTPSRGGSSPSAFYWWTDRTKHDRASFNEYEIHARNGDGTVECYLPDRWIKNQ